MTRARVLIAALLSAAALLAAVPSPAPARSQMRSVFQDDCIIVRLDPDRRCQRANPDEALDTIARLGADIVRITLIRDKAQQFGYGFYDYAVQGTLARGMTPLVSLTDRCRTPRGAKRCDRFVISPGAFAAFVRRSVERYPGVHLWSIYNEPNLRYFLKSGSARDWRRLFVAGQSALRAVPGHRRDTVLLGELAPRSTANNGAATGPLLFTREFFCLDRRLHPYRGATARRKGCANFKRVTADGFAYHPYTNAAKAIPTFRDPGDGASFATLGRLTSILDAAARRGRTNRNMAVWNTESGFESNPPDRFAPSARTQAEYINWGDWILFRNRRVATVSQYELNDAGSTPAYNTGLRFYSGKVKPALAAYRLPIFVTGAGSGHVRVWGQVRPGGANTATVQRQRGGRGPFRAVKTVRTNASGYFQVRLRADTRDLWRLKWGAFTSRVARAR